MKTNIFSRLAIAMSIPVLLAGCVAVPYASDVRKADFVKQRLDPVTIYGPDNKFAFTPVMNDPETIGTLRVTQLVDADVKSMQEVWEKTFISKRCFAMGLFPFLSQFYWGGYHSNLGTPPDDNFGDVLGYLVWGWFPTVISWPSVWLVDVNSREQWLRGKYTIIGGAKFRLDKTTERQTDTVPGEIKRGTFPVRSLNYSAYTGAQMVVPVKHKWHAPAFMLRCSIPALNYETEQLVHDTLQLRLPRPALNASSYECAVSVTIGNDVSKRKLYGFIIVYSPERYALENGISINAIPADNIIWPKDFVMREKPSPANLQPPAQPVPQNTTINVIHETPATPPAPPLPIPVLPPRPPPPLRPFR